MCFRFCPVIDSCSHFVPERSPELSLPVLTSRCYRMCVSALSRLHKQIEPLDQVPGDILSLSYLWLPLCPSCVTFHRSRRRTRRPLQRQRSPVRDDRCWAARRAPTPRLRLLRLQRRSRGKRLASGCWLPKRLRPFGRIPLRRAQTASKSTSPKPRLASETDDGGLGSKGR